MDATLTIRSQTRFRGAPLIPGAVLRVPEDVDLITARRWCLRKIARVGGRYVPREGTALADDPVPFAELERKIGKKRDDRFAALMERDKDALLDMAKADLVDVDATMPKEDIAKAIIAAIDISGGDGEE